MKTFVLIGRPAFIGAVSLTSHEGDQWPAAAQSQHQGGLYSGPSGQSGDPWSCDGPGQTGNQIYREQWYHTLSFFQTAVHLFPFLWPRGRMTLCNTSEPQWCFPLLNIIVHNQYHVQGQSLQVPGHCSQETRPFWK